MLRFPHGVRALGHGRGTGHLPGRQPQDRWQCLVPLPPRWTSTPTGFGGPPHSAPHTSGRAATLQTNTYQTTATPPTSTPTGNASSAGKTHATPSAKVSQSGATSWRVGRTPGTNSGLTRTMRPMMGHLDAAVPRLHPPPPKGSYRHHPLPAATTATHHHLPTDITPHHPHGDDDAPPSHHRHLQHHFTLGARTGAGADPLHHRPHQRTPWRLTDSAGIGAVWTG